MRSVEGPAVTVTIGSTTEQLLAAWREAERVLDQLGPAESDRDEAEARVEEARMAYQARIDASGAEASRVAEVEPAAEFAPDGSAA